MKNKDLKTTTLRYVFYTLLTCVLCVGCVDNSYYKTQEYIMDYHDREVGKVQYYLKKVNENIGNEKCALYNDSLHMAAYAQKQFALAWKNAR